MSNFCRLTDSERLVDIVRSMHDGRTVTNLGFSPMDFRSVVGAMRSLTINDFLRAASSRLLSETVADFVRFRVRRPGVCVPRFETVESVDSLD